MNCRHCGEALDGDVVPMNDGRDGMHRPCFMRAITGSEDCLRRGPHQPGTCLPDDPTLTRREAALRAYNAYLELSANQGGEEEWPEVING